VHPSLDREAPAEAGDRRAFERFVHAHRRQQAREALRQHRLTGAGRADHQQAVAVDGGDLQGALGARMALDLRQVRVAHPVRPRRRQHPGPAVGGRFGRRFAACRQELPHHVEQVLRAVDLRAGHQRGLLRARGRQHETGGDAARVQC
jgi:hypothetical protein